MSSSNRSCMRVLVLMLLAMAARWTEAIPAFAENPQRVMQLASNDLVKNNSFMVPTMDSRRILCPVMAALFNEGDLKLADPDLGTVDTITLYHALHDKLGQSAALALEQSLGITDFDWAHRVKQDHRERCFPWSACFWRQLLVRWRWWGSMTADNASPIQEEGEKRWRQVTRYINIFRMNGLEVAEHGVSTGVRGGNNNVPSFEVDGEGIYPSERRFDEFWVPCASPVDGHFAMNELKCVACRALASGDRGGEWAYNPHQAGRQWQLWAALRAMLQVFGRSRRTTDIQGRVADGDLYLTMADLRRLMFEGRYPIGWQRRPSGDALGLVSAAAANLNCPDPALIQSPWSETECPLDTGVSCANDKSACPSGAMCVSGQCLCGKDANLISMCYRDGRCTSRPDTCRYFGEPCQRTAANSPSAPW